MLSIMQSHVKGCPRNKEDREMIEGLNTILVIHYRLKKIVDKVPRYLDYDPNK
jgi:hypothetical protein